MDIVGWIVVGFLMSVTGELILPGRNPAGIGVTFLLRATGSLLTRFVVGLVWGLRGDAVRRRGNPVGRSGSVRGRGTLPAQCEPTDTLKRFAEVNTSALQQEQGLKC